MSSVRIPCVCSLVFAVAGVLPCPAEMRVGQPEALRAVVKKVQPDYNPVARKLRVQGDVEVEAHVSDSGEVVDVKVLSGNALLTPAVVKAVRDWRFTPFQQDGKPSQAVATLRFNFKL